VGEVDTSPTSMDLFVFAQEELEITSMLEKPEREHSMKSSSNLHLDSNSKKQDRPTTFDTNFTCAIRRRDLR
jgi:hypothetical protein